MTFLDKAIIIATSVGIAFILIEIYDSQFCKDVCCFDREDEWFT